MPPKQQVFAIVVALLLLGVVVELVRRRRLRIEYSWLWLITAVGIFGLVLRYDILVLITHAIGAVLPTTTLFLFALIFLFLVGVHFSLKISELTTQMTNVSQEIAVLRLTWEQDRAARLGQGAEQA